MSPGKKAILFVFGTRPEAIKMAPIINRFAGNSERFRTVVAVTAQHRQMLDQVLELFSITPDHDLDIMVPDQTLGQVTAKAIAGLDQLIERERPDFVFVQGDTTSTFAGALAAFYHRIPVGHVEAGLRTNDRFRPYPEEVNRIMVSSLTDLHFAPTDRSRDNLLEENVPPERIHVTGNTVIDALMEVAGREHRFGDDLREAFAERGKRKILVTIHRRENHGPPTEIACNAILELLDSFPDVEMLFPVHMNPRVIGRVFPLLESHSRVHLIPPLDYLSFVNAMKSTYFMLTDSGGVQEEAPALSKPVLLLREISERPEAIEAGTVKLVGCTDAGRIVAEASRLLSDPDAYQAMAKSVNPYGDGRAAQRILDIVDRFLHA